MQDKYESVDFFGTPLTQFSPESELLSELNYKDCKMELEESCIQNPFSFGFKSGSSKKIPHVDEKMLLFSIDDTEKELNQVKVSYQVNDDLQFSPSGSNSPSFEILPLWLEKEFATVKGKSQDDIDSDLKETQTRKSDGLSQETTQSPQLTECDKEHVEEQSTSCVGSNDNSLPLDVVK